MPKRIRREYLQLVDAAKAAAESAIDAFNRVRHPYRRETTLILLANAWELLAKAVLVQAKESISRGQRGETIAGEVAVFRLQQKGLIDANQAQTVQQVISLRHSAVHHLLPPVPDEVMHHLLYFSCKFFRDPIAECLPAHAKDLDGHYLSLSFADLTTYADKVQRAVAKVRKSQSERRLVWLLERGIRFDGSAYITEAQLEQRYKGKKQVMPHLDLGKFVRTTDMVRVVPIQAPRNYTADIKLRKGNAKDASLPVLIQKTDLEADYPFLTRELGQKVGRSQNWIARAVTVLNLKGDPKYHQAVRASAKGSIQRYSNAALERIKQKLTENSSFDPYHDK
jgi:hypothetical protein